MLPAGRTEKKKKEKYTRPKPITRGFALLRPRRLVYHRGDGTTELYRAVVWNKGGKRDASKKRKKDSKMFEGEESPFVESRRGGGHGQIAIRKTNRVGKKRRALQRFLNALSLHKGITSMILT